jgi:hypothetical protein
MPRLKRVRRVKTRKQIKDKIDQLQAGIDADPEWDGSGPEELGDRHSSTRVLIMALKWAIGEK